MVVWVVISYATQIALHAAANDAGSDITASQHRHNDLLEWSKRPYSVCYSPQEGPSEYTLMTMSEMKNKHWQTLLRRNRLCYCAMHNCTYCELPARLDPNRAPSWAKIPAYFALKHLNEFTIAVDADAVIMNRRIDFQDIIKRYMDDHTDVLFTANLDTPRGTTLGDKSICCGVFIFRSNSESVHLMLKDAYSKNAVDDIWWEQRAILEYLDKYPQMYETGIVRIIPWENMQTPAVLYEAQDFIKHHAGMEKDLVEMIEDFESHSCCNSLFE